MLKKVLQIDKDAVEQTEAPPGKDKDATLGIDNKGGE